MEIWIWLGLAVILSVIEIITYNLVTVWFAIGAAVAFVLSLIGVPPIWQFVCFVFVSAILLIFTKPLVSKKLTVKNQPTNADRVIGKTGVVINVDDSVGELFLVRVIEQVWTAKTIDGSLLAVGDEVKVLNIQGVKLIVEKMEKKKEE